jgi:hypothetical protein
MTRVKGLYSEPMWHEVHASPVRVWSSFTVGSVLRIPRDVCQIRARARVIPAEAFRRHRFSTYICRRRSVRGTYLQQASSLCIVEFRAF